MNCDRNCSIIGLPENMYLTVISSVQTVKKIKNNVIDCNIKLLGLNSKNLPAERKKLFLECRPILCTNVKCTN